MVEKPVDSPNRGVKNVPTPGAGPSFSGAARLLPFGKRVGVSVREFHYRWKYDLRASPQALWPLVSDTNRFNRDAGLPGVSAQRSVEVDESVGRRRLRLKKLGLGVEWEEEPFEWVRPFRFGVVRRYHMGPIAEMRVAAELSAREDGGTHLVYDVRVGARGALGRALVPLQVGRVGARAGLRRSSAATTNSRSTKRSGALMKVARSGSTRASVCCSARCAKGSWASAPTRALPRGSARRSSRPTS